MKSKTKFDPQVIQQFFIDHAEKFVMGLVAALFLFFTYQSVTLTVYEKYTKKPDELKRATEAASDKIAAGPATKKAEEVNASSRPTRTSSMPPEAHRSRCYPMPPLFNCT